MPSLFLPRLRLPSWATLMENARLMPISQSPGPSGASLNSSHLRAILVVVLPPIIDAFVEDFNACWFSQHVIL